MPASIVAPLAAIPLPPLIAALPKADLHIHQERLPRLDRVLARREGRPPFDWLDWARWVMTETPAGAERLARLGEVEPTTPDADAEPANIVARLEELLEEAAADGAVFVEVRVGGDTALRPDLMERFREAEQRLRKQHPRLRAEVVFTLYPWHDPENRPRLIRACLRAAAEGMRGIDFMTDLVQEETDWISMYRFAEQAAAAGLGITAHAGEVSTANIEAALRIPGLTRIGHGTQAARDSRLLDLLAESGVTLEVCLSCNVVLGAAPSYEEHPIRQFLEHGIAVALGSDDPVQICTTIGREYAAAHALGFSPADLLALTRTAIRAAFTTPERRDELLTEFGAWEEKYTEDE
jgi:adenosine deaminase